MLESADVTDYSRHVQRPSRPGHVLALALVCALPSACRRDGATGEAPAAAPAGTPRVALVMKSLANEFFKNMEDGARAHQAQHARRYTLIASGIKDEQDTGRQIALVEQFVAQGVDAIVLAPADSRALVAAVARAVKAGVVVVNIDNRLDPALLADKGLQVPFVGPSNRKGARLAAEHLARHLPAGAPVAILEGLPTADNARERRQGFEDGITAAGLELVSRQAANWEMGKASQVAAAILTEHPEVKALLCANDSMALGALSALRAAGRQKDVLVVGFDNISAARELVDRGELLATVDQHAGELAVFGIEAALELVHARAGKQATAVAADRETPVELVARAEQP